ncbi:DUF58 domain-containing protein [Mesorhizobium sp. RMAD-H1]|uniref:DUF58 domain-containing protein n=1 Tax=Mesorhizobium sp. RMAD-H1 TaxID=2587065 RepID=UPI0017B3DA01|nr:DUF58 domain-containing protein [Mesorhizobium sp. RMAD-H1]MBB2974067.1 uncharacterized protein (DUF58 family) [Mesorhizobium sp. RMAD-H1]
MSERVAALPPLFPVPYRLAWRPGSMRPGAHHGSGEGGSGAFRRHVPLLQHPDPRRIDFRRTFQDPMGEVHVRRFAPRSAITLIAFVDLSGSMGFEGHVRRMAVVAELCATLALSAHKTGDRFGLIGCDSSVRKDVFIAPAHRRGLEVEVFDLLARARPGGASVRGLAETAGWLPARRSLVFLISDFLFPVVELEGILDALWRHDIVPVLPRDSGEDEDVPAWGLVELRDLETGRRRLTVMRPALRDRWRRARQERFSQLDRLFGARGRLPVHLVDRFDPDELAESLIGE